MTFNQIIQKRQYSEKSSAKPDEEQRRKREVRRRIEDIKTARDLEISISEMMREFL